VAEDEISNGISKAMLAMVQMIMMMYILQYMMQYLQQSLGAIGLPGAGKEEGEEEEGEGGEGEGGEIQYEDLSTFTEEDPNGVLTVEQYSVSAENMRRDDPARLYKDYGAGHFGNFDIRWKVTLHSYSGDMADSFTLISDNLGYGKSDIVDGLKVIYSYSEIIGNPTISLYKYVGGSSTKIGDYQISTETSYYLKFVRDNGTIHLYIYSDEDMQNLLTEISGDVSDLQSSFSKLVFISGRYDTSTNPSSTISITVENLRIVKAN